MAIVVTSSGEPVIDRLLALPVADAHEMMPQPGHCAGHLGNLDNHRAPSTTIESCRWPAMARDGPRRIPILSRPSLPHTLALGVAGVAEFARVSRSKTATDTAEGKTVTFLLLRAC